MKKEFLQEGKFYRVLEEDGTTYNGFQNSTRANGVTKVSDWNPDPNIICGEGLHVVEGHPFMAFRFVNRENPIFFEVETEPNPPVMSSGGGKYRCKKVRNKRRLTKRSPEFRPELLVRIINKEDEDGYVRQAAIKRLDPQKHAQLIVQIAKEDKNGYVRQAAVERLNPPKHSQLLARIAWEDWDWYVRRAAVKRLDPQKHARLLARIAKEDNNVSVRRAAVEKLDSLKV